MATNTSNSIPIFTNRGNFFPARIAAANVASDGSGNYNYVFTVTAANATAGATYTNNSQTFTVITTIAGATTLTCSGTGQSLASGTLTKASGTGDATITFSAVTQPTLVTIVTSATDGTRIDGVRFRNASATATTSSAMQHRIFLSDTSGLNLKLIGEVATAAGATRATQTNIGATSIYTFDQPIIMRLGQIMVVCQSVYANAADQFDACAFAGDY